jgi:hypothetical protein
MTRYHQTTSGHRRLVLTIAFTTALVLATGLLGTVATAAGASPPKLKAMLLSIGQMPTGWGVYNEPSNGLGCLANVLEPKGIKQTAKASVEFVDNGSFPAVVERLATFTNAKTAYKKIDANLTACKHLSGTTGGQKFSGTVGQMSFPHYGNESAAFWANFTIQGAKYGEDLLIVRKGNIVMGIDEGNLAPVTVSQFQGFVKKAIKKVV